MKQLLLIAGLACAAVQSKGQNKPAATDSNQQKPESKPLKDCCCEFPADTCAELKAANVKIKETDKILFDFRTKQLAFPTTVRRMGKRSVFQVKILNYNPHLYKVVVDDKDSSIAAGVDGKLLSWFIDPSNLAGIVASLVSNVGTVPAGDPKQPDVKQFELALANLKARPQLMSEGYNLEDEDKIIPSRNPSMAAERVEDIFERHAVFMEARRKELDTLNDRIGKRQYGIAKHFSARRMLFPDCQSFTTGASEASIQGLERDMAGFRTAIASAQQKLADDLTKYYIAIAKYRTVIDENESLKANDSIINNFYKEAKTLLGEAAKSISYKNVSDIIAQLETLAQSSSCYTSAPIFMLQHAKTVTLEFKPRFDSLAIPAYKTTFVLPDIQSRVFGISGGIHFSGLHNESYTNRTVPQPGQTPDTAYQLVANNIGKTQFGINSLAYAGWKLEKTNDKANYMGVAFGAGLSIESKPKPRVLLGATFITGEENRLLITAGVLMGHVSRLASAFDLTTKYGRPAADFLVDRIKSSAFISVNYSFLNR